MVSQLLHPNTLGHLYVKRWACIVLDNSTGGASSANGWQSAYQSGKPQNLLLAGPLRTSELFSLLFAQLLAVRHVSHTLKL